MKELDNVIHLLIEDKPLDARYKDHKLVGGQYPNCRDCHIRPDIVLVYSKTKDKLILELVRLGQHNHLKLTSSLDTSI